jgi:hypothetical protein
MEIEMPDHWEHRKGADTGGYELEEITAQGSAYSSGAAKKPGKDFVKDEKTGLFIPAGSRAHQRAGFWPGD